MHLFSRDMGKMLIIMIRKIADNLQHDRDKYSDPAES